MKVKTTRVYTKKSFKLMLTVRKIIILLFTPLWLPLFLISWSGFYIQWFLDTIDTILDKFLDKVIPQLK